MKKSKLILLIVGVVLVITGITYAAFTWVGKTNIKGSAECFDVNYVKGRDIGSDENKQMLKIGDGPLDGVSSTIEVGLNNKCTITSGSGTLYIEVDDSTSNILITSGILKYQIIDGNNIAVEEGTITSKGSNVVYDNFKITSTNKPIIVIVWLDSSKLTQDNRDTILSSTFSGKVNVKVESRRE